MVNWSKVTKLDEAKMLSLFAAIKEAREALILATMLSLPCKGELFGSVK